MATFDEKLDAMLTKATELKEQVSREAQESRDVTANFQTAVDNLTAERDRLQAIIDSGQATPAQEAKLDEINAALDDAKAGIDQIVNPTSPPPVDPNAPPV